MRSPSAAQLTRAELQLVLEAAGISTAGQRLPHLLMHAELEAVLCSGGVRGRQHTWALVDDRTPAARPFDREETLRSTTLQFVRSHGPVTVRDLAWWSGLALRDVRHGLELARPVAAVLEVGGRRYWYVEEPPAAGSGGPAVHLVQSFDEFLVAYSESRDLVDPAGFAKHMPRAALLGPSLLVDGRSPAAGGAPSVRPESRSRSPRSGRWSRPCEPPSRRRPGASRRSSERRCG